MFWFKLAALWGCTVREAQQRIDASEFAEWQAYYQLEPWGTVIGDVRHADLMAMTANVHGAKRDGQLFTIDDFMPERAREIREAIEQEATADADAEREAERVAKQEQVIARLMRWAGAEGK